MCGIAGIANLEASRPPSREELERMVGVLHHRGPDEHGYYRDERVGLGHARLSIIDLSGGKQPIHNEDRTVWVIFNGEIFNYLELRGPLLQQGHTFYTDSDTEVIVHLYEQYGDEFVHKLNGQFAIAVWDTRRRRLLLARDRPGVRPLFYSTVDGRLVFASEVKSLFTLPSMPRRLDVQALGEVFTYWSPLEPRTAFEGVKSLPPGHLMVIEDGVQTPPRRYWDWEFEPGGPSRERPLAEYVEEARALLIDAVRLRLRADVPVGAYLSGGLDSSIITALIKNYTETPLRTFSIGFEDPEFDETRHQDELVAHLGTDHTAVRCTTRDIGEVFPRTIWHTEATILRTAPAPLMMLSERVRAAGYKVVLTGEGADEVFGGYDLFKEAKVRRFWARRPTSKLRPAILSRLYPYLKSSPTGTRGFSAGFFGQGLEQMDAPYSGHLPRWTTTQRAWRFFDPEVRSGLGAFDAGAAIRANLPEAIGAWPPLCRDQYIEGHTLLSGYLLSSQGDRVGMASSIEGRFPFLDVRVMEFANRLPVRYKLMGLNEKFLLKRAFGGLLPPSIAQRTKQPYRAPDSQSFFQDGKPAAYVADLLSPGRLRQSGYFDPEATGKLIEKCRTGRAIGFSDNMAFVGILSTMLLDELFIRPARMPTRPDEVAPIARRRT